MKTIIIGLGNTILRDDGVGIRAAEKIKHLIDGKGDVEITELSVGGMRLMETLCGYDRAFIIDAVMTGQNPPGTIHTLHIDDLGMSLHTSSTHDTSFACALEIGRKIGIKLPSEIILLGIEAADVNNFGEEMTEAVECALPFVVQRVLEELDRP